MTTTKSYSKFKNIFSVSKKSIKQAIPFSIVTAVIFAILVHLPNSLFSSFYTSYPEPSKYVFEYSFYIGMGHTVATTMFLAIMTFVIALSLNGYLFSKSKTDFYHSLPIKRTSLLTSNFITAMIAIGGPYVIVSLISMLFYGITQQGHLAKHFVLYSLSEILFTLLYMAIIYLFVTLICVSVGTSFDGVVLSGVIGFIPLFVYIIFYAYQEYYLYGFSMSNDMSFIYLSPFLFIVKKYMLYYASDYNNVVLGYVFAIITALVLIGIFYIAAQLLYRARKSENAENKLLKGWPQVISKIFVAFCSSAMFFAIFSEQDIFVRFITSIIMAFAISLVFEIVLSRGVRGIKANIKWLLIGIVAFFILIAAIMLDITGYQKRLPASSSVASVTIDYRGNENDQNNQYDYSSVAVPLTDPEAIGIIVDTHANIIANKPEDHRNNYNYSYSSFDVEYTLKNGQKLRRSYSSVDPDIIKELGNLDSMPSFIESRHPIFIYDNFEENITSAIIEHSSLIGNSYSSNSTRVHKDDYGAIVEALKKDVIKLPPSATSKEAVIFELSISYSVTDDSSNYNNRYSRYYSYYGESEVQIPITAQYVNTISALEALGYNVSAQVI